MAKYDGKFLRGIIGPVILKKSGDRQQVVPRTAPGTVKQTSATKQASHTFGMASGLSGQIRGVLDQESCLAQDGSVHPRLGSALNQLLMRARDPVSRKFSFNTDSFHGLAGFQFNARRRLSDKLPGRLEMNLDGGLLHVAFPGGDRPRKLKFVKGSNACKLTLSVVLFRLAEGLVCRTADRRSVLVERETFDLSGLSFSFEVPNDCLYLLAVSMEYYKGKIPIADFTQNTGAIYEAGVIKGEYDQHRKFLWSDNDLYFK